MAGSSVEQWLADLMLADPDRHALVQAAREVIAASVPGVSERVMYGGIMCFAPQAFCGVFAYTGHVSVEFGKGSELDDPLGVLEGQGKARRHIKLRLPGDIAAKHLSDYVRRAHQLG